MFWRVSCISRRVSCVSVRTVQCLTVLKMTLDLSGHNKIAAEILDFERTYLFLVFLCATEAQFPSITLSCFLASNIFLRNQLLFCEMCVF